MRYADFPTLVDALDYAALSSAGMNFYDRRCQLEDQLEYQTLKARAEAVKTILVNKYKINPSRITAEGQGVGDMFTEPDWNRVSICSIIEDAK
jgi:hypothetical protein